MFCSYGPRNAHMISLRLIHVEYYPAGYLGSLPSQGERKDGLKIGWWIRSFPLELLRKMHTLEKFNNDLMMIDWLHTVQFSFICVCLLALQSLVQIRIG